MKAAPEMTYREIIDDPWGLGSDGAYTPSRISGEFFSCPELGGCVYRPQRQFPHRMELGDMMKKIIAIAFIAALFTALFTAGATGIASATAASPGSPPGRDIVTTTFHCPAPRNTFTIRADPWVMSQYEWYYGEQGCTYTT